MASGSDNGFKPDSTKVTEVTEVVEAENPIPMSLEVRRDFNFAAAENLLEQRKTDLNNTIEIARELMKCKEEVGDIQRDLSVTEHGFNSKVDQCFGSIDDIDRRVNEIEGKIDFLCQENAKFNEAMEELKEIIEVVEQLAREKTCCEFCIMF